MSLSEVFRFAVRGLLANKLRSVLTTLGIVIGVAAVILMTALGNGASATIQKSISSLGTNTLTITTARPQSRDAPPATPLTEQDVAAVADRAGTPDVASVSPVVVSSQVAARHADNSYQIRQVAGSTPSYFDATNSVVQKGSAFTADDVAQGRKVVVLGATTAQQLFGADTDPLGQQALINNLPFTVIGVLQGKGSGGFQNSDDIAIAPLTTVRSALTGSNSLSQVVVKAASPDVTNAAQAEVSAVLDVRHHITSPDRADYQVINPQQLVSTINTTLGAFTVLLAGIAGISLLVGGIGITNIMLVTVTERTAEIGLRKALGAPKRVILFQFLAESTMLSVFGGALGVLIGLLGSQVQIGTVRPAVSLNAVLLAVGVSVLIGLFFGSYPANRAAALNPIEALRHE